MTSKKRMSRITAAMLSALMSATVCITPTAYQFTQFTQVIAAETAVNLKLTAIDSDDDDAPNKGRIAVPADAKSVTFNFETTAKEKLSFGVFGAELKSAPYWADISKDFSVTPVNGKGSFTYQIPSDIQGDVKKICIGLWYPKDGVTVTFTSISTDGTAMTNPDDPNTPLGPQDKPSTANTKSGSYTFTDNKDGTATISATLTAEVDDLEMDYLLTAGYDEEGYLDKEKYPDGYTEGAPINSHKFAFSEFGLEDIDEIRIQSFNYTIESDEEISRFQYGGGINVTEHSPADTEYAKGKNGYWYNDQGDEDVEKYGAELDALGINYNKGGYIVENAGNYMEIVWDVPSDVQQYVTTRPTDTVGFQFWYAQAANPPEGEDYAEVSEVHLKSASCTYTREMTVPYNKTDNQKVGKKLTPGSDESSNQVKFDLSSLNLKERDLISAVKFNVTSSADLKKLTTGVGISVGDTVGELYDYWYTPASNITVLSDPATNKYEIMWIIPEEIRKYVSTLSEEGNLMFGAWYAGTGTEGAAPTVTLDSIDFYERISTEKELVVQPEKLELEIGESKKLVMTVDPEKCEFKVSNDKVVTVDKDGTITAIGAGLTDITVTTPEGQEVIVTVKVNDKPTTTATSATTATSSTTTTSSSTTTTTKSPVTTPPVNPDDVIDPAKVKYGDVNLDGKVNVADIVALNLYLVNSEKNPLNATARENAQCLYDSIIDAQDSTTLMNYVAMVITLDKLGKNAELGITG